ncbi:MAG: DUF2520 domain-containing protein [Actinobacteria bacterium]|nr:MAG: DUF2520 domain-containing protein [Actinomycetota bacterium]
MSEPGIRQELEPRPCSNGPASSGPAASAARSLPASPSAFPRAGRVASSIAAKPTSSSSASPTERYPPFPPGSLRARGSDTRAVRCGWLPSTLTRDGSASTRSRRSFAIAGPSSSTAPGARSELARLLGLRPFELADEERPLYHAGAVVAASFLVTLHEVAAELFEAAGAPPEALEPLMRRTIENDFRATGPHVRGDDVTVEDHLRVIRERRPQLEPLYRTLSRTTETLLADPTRDDRSLAGRTE